MDSKTQERTHGPGAVSTQSRRTRLSAMLIGAVLSALPACGDGGPASEVPDAAGELWICSLHYWNQFTFTIDIDGVRWFDPEEALSGEDGDAGVMRAGTSCLTDTIVYRNGDSCFVRDVPLSESGEASVRAVSNSAGFSRIELRDTGLIVTLNDGTVLKDAGDAAEVGNLGVREEILSARLSADSEACSAGADRHGCVVEIHSAGACSAYLRFVRAE